MKSGRCQVTLHGPAFRAASAFWRTMAAVLWRASRMRVAWSAVTRTAWPAWAARRGRPSNGAVRQNSRRLSALIFYRVARGGKIQNQGTDTTFPKRRATRCQSRGLERELQLKFDPAVAAGVVAASGEERGRLSEHGRTQIPGGQRQVRMIEQVA